MRLLTVIIPGSLYKELNPNWQPRSEGARWIKTGAITNAKRLAYFYALDARNQWERKYGFRWDPLERAEIECIIGLGPRAKEWDETNTRAALKPMEDALCAGKEHETCRAAIIRDDSPAHIHWLPIRWERSKEASIRIEIREVGWKMNGG